MVYLLKTIADCCMTTIWPMAIRGMKKQKQVLRWDGQPLDVMPFMVIFVSNVYLSMKGLGDTRLFFNYQTK